MVGAADQAGSVTAWRRLWCWLTRGRTPSEISSDSTEVQDPRTDLPPWAREPDRRLTQAEAAERARPRPAPPWEREKQRQANLDALDQDAAEIRRRYARRRRD